jgi:Ca2+-binding EF-hand superfamily protein
VALRFFASGVILFLGAALLGVSPGEAAGPPAKPAPERPGRDVQDLVFFADQRPIFIRLHLRVDGKAFRDVWDGYIDHVFRYVDVNGDGWLSKAELERLPPMQTLYGSSPAYSKTGGSMEALDTNRDGKVSREELGQYFRRVGAVPFQINGGSAERDLYASQLLFAKAAAGAFPGGGSSQETLTNRFFQLLDTNKDGKLSRAELKAGIARLAKLDTDDDEMITADELMGQGNRGVNPYEAEVAVRFLNRVGRPSGSSHFQIMDSKKPDPKLARRLLEKYGKGGKTLTRHCLGMDEKSFASLDADGDGNWTPRSWPGSASASPMWRSASMSANASLACPPSKRCGTHRWPGWSRMKREFPFWHCLVRDWHWRNRQPHPAASPYLKTRARNIAGNSKWQTPTRTVTWTRPRPSEASFSAMYSR